MRRTWEGEQRNEEVIKLCVFLLPLRQCSVLRKLFASSWAVPLRSGAVQRLNSKHLTGGNAVDLDDKKARNKNSREGKESERV